ncbi:hypothetical protein DU490_01195 [Halomonas sp. DQ26W]|uniref:hypothetical protein n=1 Tax=Halomonas sp. DQ26W TaxID=2282311 RepID=UPI000DF78746|nr:hypothetical protein [Halomonas sp. DQ26W]RDB44560.1 hypothetical protein DU490_01195 [Halomonas sp. DQ26W]
MPGRMWLAGVVTTLLVALSPSLPVHGLEPSLDGVAPLLVLGSDDEVAIWLAEQALDGPPSAMTVRGEGRMWMLPESRVAVVSASEPGQLQRLVALLKHHQHRSYLLQDAEGDTLDAGVWPLDEASLRVDFAPSR